MILKCLLYERSEALTLLTGKELSKFQKTIIFTFLTLRQGVLDHGDEGTMILQNTGHHLYEIQEELNNLSPACFSHPSLPAFNIPTNTMCRDSYYCGHFMSLFLFPFYCICYA